MKVVHHNPGAKVAFVFAHPSTSYADHFLSEALRERGVGVLNVDGRYVGDAHDLSFHDAALDVARAIDAHVSKDTKVVLTGHSGGASLLALAHVRLGVGDRIALLAAHPSRAHILQDWIDPLTYLDGERPKPPFSSAFVATYRRAQRARIHAIAEQASKHLREGNPDAPVHFPHACADLRFVDRTLDANARGGFPFGDPAVVNERTDFFGGWTTARSFLDQWYLPTTTANGIALAPFLRGPVLHLIFEADALVFPSQSALWTRALPDASVDVIRGAAHNPRGQESIVRDLAERLLAFTA
ncbi:MAG: alpha/beta fold hydrolase [Myxococcota bacterium]